MSLFRRIELECLAAVLRHSNVQKGRWRLQRRAMSLVRHHLPAYRTVILRTRAGFRMRVDGASQVGRVVFATGEYEPDVARVLRALASAGATVLDVGAHVGYFTVLAARAVGPTGTVIAIEPQRHVRAELERNIALNHLHNVEVHAVAAFDARGERRLYLEQADSTGQASLRQTAGGAEEVITTCPLDELIGDRPIHLVKMDAEGAEMNILQGMIGILRRSAPDLVIEVTDTFLRSFGYSAVELQQFLGGFGYSAYLIREQGLSPVVPGYAWTEQENVLFTSRPNVIDLVAHPR